MKILKKFITIIIIFDEEGGDTCRIDMKHFKRLHGINYYE